MKAAPLRPGQGLPRDRRLRLAELGATPYEVVRTRVFLKDISRWKEAGQAHSEVFGEIKPATTFVQVTGFLDPGFLLEVETTAIVD